MTSNPLTAMLDTLREHGWTCAYPRSKHFPVIDGKTEPSVYVTGPIWHIKDGEIFLADDGRVFLCGDLHRAHGKDIDFAEFLRWLKLPEPVWDEAAPVKKVLKGQRGLFGDEE